MEMLETEHQVRLMTENEEYRRLAEQHRKYEEKLEHIANRRPFTQDDWFEESVVKKRKLLLKDQMEQVARTSVPAPSLQA